MKPVQTKLKTKFVVKYQKLTKEDIQREKEQQKQQEQKEQKQEK